MKKHKRRMPTYSQWRDLRGIIANGWGDGDYAEAYGEREKLIRAIRAFECWIEDRYNVTFKNRIT